MAKIFIKRNDTKGFFQDTLEINGSPIDLTGCTVYFLLRNTRFNIRQLATITQTAPPPDPSAGGVMYQPLIGDVSQDGDFMQEWEVYFTDGERLTVPNNKYNEVVILKDLA